jgi:hypothetical protein
MKQVFVDVTTIVLGSLRCVIEHSFLARSRVTEIPHGWEADL